MTARDSSGGISKVRIANAGQVAHSGIDKAPMRVQVFRESGYCLGRGGLSVPNDNGALDMLDIPGPNPLSCMVMEMAGEQDTKGLASMPGNPVGRSRQYDAPGKDTFVRLA